MSTYSFSQVWTFQTCPRKYQYQYIDKLGKESKEDSLTLTLWTVFHATLEHLYKSKSNTITLSLEDLIVYYDDLWTQELENYMEQPVEADLHMFQSRGREYLQWYYETYAPFDTRVMGTEERVRSIFDEQISFRWIVDRLDADGDTIVITDYKTSRRLMPDTEDHNREQLVLYAHGIRQSYWRKFSQIQWLLIYPHLHKEYRFRIEDDEIAEVVDKYLTIMRDIESRKANHENLFADGVDQFPAIAGNHCNYCPFRQICPKWKHEYMNDEVLWSDLGEGTISSFVSDYLRISEQYKKLDAERKYLTQLITQRMQDKEITRRDVDTGWVGMQTKTSYSIKPDHQQDVLDYLQSHGQLDQVMSVQSATFSSKISKWEIDLSDITDYVQSKESAWLLPKKIKEK